jgi:hypothetical protein
VIDSPDLWEVRELPGELALELRAGNDPALVLTRARTGSACSLPTSRRWLTWLLALGQVMPAGQDNGSQWQWVVNTQPEVGRMKVVVIQQGGRQWQRTRRMMGGNKSPSDYPENR